MLIINLNLNSVSVSVLTIKGTECDLLHLGQVANLSGGNVLIIISYYPECTIRTDQVLFKLTSFNNP